jgi:hypothetical protein
MAEADYSGRVRQAEKLGKPAGFFYNWPLNTGSGRRLTFEEEQEVLARIAPDVLACWESVPPERRIDVNAIMRAQPSPGDD